MGNSNSKNNNQSRPKFTGTIVKPVYWEEDSIYENPLTEPKQPEIHIPDTLTKEFNHLSDEGKSNVYWNGFGLGLDTAKDDLDREQWERSGNTVAGGISHSITQRLDNNGNGANEPKIAKSISRSNRNSADIPPLEIDKVKESSVANPKGGNLANNTLYDGMMPLIPEESFRFLKLDNPRVVSLMGNHQKIEGIENLNSRALNGQKKRFSLKFEVEEKSVGEPSSQNYPIRPMNTLDMELNDINTLESKSGINFALHSIKADINQSRFSKQVLESFVIAESKNGSPRKATNLKEQANINKDGKEKKLNVKKSISEGPSLSQGTQKPKDLKEFRVKLSSIKEISSHSFETFKNIKNKGKIQIEVVVPDSYFYSHNYFKICPLPFDVEQTERGSNIELIFGPGEDTPSPEIEIFKTDVNQRSSSQQISLKVTTQKECINMSERIKKRYAAFWEDIKSNQTDKADLKVRVWTNYLGIG